MAYDFDSVNLPKMGKGGGGQVMATTFDNGSVRICATSNDCPSMCINLSKKDAIDLAKFLSEVYL